MVSIIIFYLHFFILFFVLLWLGSNDMKWDEEKNKIERNKNLFCVKNRKRNTYYKNLSIHMEFMKIYSNLRRFMVSGPAVEDNILNEIYICVSILWRLTVRESAECIAVVVKSNGRTVKRCFILSRETRCTFQRQMRVGSSETDFDYGN